MLKALHLFDPRKIVFGEKVKIDATRHNDIPRYLKPRRKTKALTDVLEMVKAKRQ